MHCNWLPGITFVMAVITPSGKSPYMFYYTLCNAVTTSLAKQKQPASRYKKRAMYNLIIVLSVDSDLHRFSAVTPGGLAPTSRILALPCSLLRTHQHLPGLCSSTRQSSFT